MNKMRNRLIALLSAVLLLVSAFAGINWVAVTAEDAADADTYMANNYPGARWSLISATDVNALHGNNTCRNGGEWDAANSAYTKLGRGTVIKVEDVDFGTGKTAVDLSINAPATAADEPVYIYVGDESYKAVGNMKPNAMYLTDGSGAFTWHKAVFADFTGITGKQTVYIVTGSNSQAGALFSLNGLRFSSSTVSGVKGVYVANGEVSTDATLKHTFNEQLVGGVSTNKYIEFANVDLTGVAGITVRAGFKDGNKAYTVAIDGAEVGTVDASRATKIDHGEYSFMRFSELALSGYTGTHTVRITAKNSGMNVLGIELTPAATEEPSEPETSEPEESEPETSEEETVSAGTYVAANDSWTILTKAEVNAVHNDGCRNEPKWNADNTAIEGMQRGSVVKVSGVNFDNVASIELSVKSSQAGMLFNIFVGEENWKALKVSARVLISDTTGEFVWTNALWADFAGISGTQDVYIASAGNKFTVSLNALRFADAATGQTVYPASSDTTVWENVGSHGSYTANPSALTIGGINQAKAAEWKVNGIDLTNATGLVVYTGYNADNGALTLKVDGTEVGTVTMANTANDRHYGASTVLPLSGYTGAHSVSICSVADVRNYGILAVAVITADAAAPAAASVQAAPVAETEETIDPADVYMANNVTGAAWALMSVADVNAIHGNNVCREGGKWDADNSFYTNLSRGTVIRVENVDFGDGKESVELSINAPATAVDEPVYIYVGDESFGAAGNMKPNAMYLTDGAAAFGWHKAVYADFAGITGKQTVYIVAGANSQEAARFSLNGLRFAAADTTATVKGVYVANGEASTNATLKHTVNEQLVGSVSNGKYIEFANVDLTDVAGITVRAGFKDGNKEYVVSIDGTDVGSVTASRATKIDHGEYSFMRFTELALSGYTGTHTVRVTSKNGGMNLLGIELTLAAEEESSEAESSETTEPESSEEESSAPESSAPESSEPESSEEESSDPTVSGAAPETPTAPHWSVVTKAEIDGIHGTGTCRNEGGMSDGVVTGLGRGTVIKVENVDFGNGKASIQLSLKVPATAADEPVYIYVGDEKFNAKGQAQPNAWFRTTANGEFTWHDALKADFTGITGLQTVYIVAGGHSEEVNKFELNGMKLLDEAPKATMRPYYVSYNGPITAMASIRTTINECLVATITSAADKNTVYIKDVDFTDAIALTGYIAFEGAGTKAFDVYLDEDTTPIGRISITSEATKGGNYRFRPASVTLVGKDITGVHDVKLVSINSNINLMGIELALATETEDDEMPEDTYMVNATDWVVIPKDTVNETNADVCRDEPSWNLDGYISGMGRGSVVKVLNVDFGDGKETMELNVKVPSGSANRQIYVYVGDESYTAETHVPDARFLLTTTNGYDWQTAIDADFSGITGVQTVYLVGASDQSVTVDIQGIRFAEKKASNTTWYVAEPENWEVTAGASKYQPALNGAIIGGTTAGTNEIQIKNVDLTDAAMLNLYVGASGDVKIFSIWAGDILLGNVTAPVSTYNAYVASSTLDLSEFDLTGVNSLTVICKNNSYNLLGVALGNAAAAAEDPNLKGLGVYGADENSWGLVNGGQDVRDNAVWNPETEAFEKVARNTWIEVKDVNFGEGYTHLEVYAKVPASAANRTLLVYLDSVSATGNEKAPIATVILSESGEFTWQMAANVDIAGITGYHNLYLVGSTDSADVSFDVKGVRLSTPARPGYDEVYTANEAWTVTGGALNTNSNGFIIGNTDKPVIDIPNVNLENATGLGIYAGADGGDKAVRLAVLDAAGNELAAADITLKQSSFYTFNLSELLDLSELDLLEEAGYTVRISSEGGTFNVLGIRVVNDPDKNREPDPEGTYTARPSTWRHVPESEHGFDERGNVAWSEELQAFIGVGRMSMLEVLDVDFGDGYNFMELLVKVPENCDSRFVHVFVDDYTTGEPQARFWLEQTEGDEFYWQGQFAQGFEDITGVHTLYIVSATDQQANQFSIKGLRLSDVTVQATDETIYTANSKDWIKAGGLAGKYKTEPNNCIFGDNNEILLEISGIDWTGVTGISLMAGCDGDDKAATFWKGNPLTDIFGCEELGSVTLSKSSYYQYNWSDFVNITGKMSGNEPIYVQSVGRNFNIYALRTTKADLGELEDTSKPSTSTPDVDEEDNSSDSESETDNPDTGVPFAVLPVALALTAGAALTISKKRAAR